VVDYENPLHNVNIEDDVLVVVEQMLMMTKMMMNLS
jgi:hypothetical protein